MKVKIGLFLALVVGFTGLVFVYAQSAADADFDGNGIVGFNDFVAFAAKFGTSSGDSGYEAKYDLNGDGQVGFADFVAFARFFGQSSVPNDPPVLERIGDQGVPVGVPLAIELVASDPDDDNLTYHVSGNPAGSSFSGSTFRWMPTSGEGSTRRVTFTVNDGRGGTDSETITIRVVEFRFKLVGHRITTEAPSFVNILFQVLDLDNWGVTALTTEHFEVRENDQEVSPTESAMRVQKRRALPHRFKLKTVLMLDTSTSVKDHLEQIKEAAIVLVENMTENQEIALYEFSEHPVQLHDFTNDVEALTKAIREIRLGFSTTNLYGSIITGTRRWQDVFTTNEVQQGFLVILTDGSDTQGSYTLSEALEARGSKNIYTIGLGNEIDPEVLKELGNAGFFQISDVTELADQLAEKFVEIQKRIVSFADSFYWLRYLSPKRGDREHRLELRVKGNEHNFMLYGDFNSRAFYSVRQGLYVNASPSDLYGIEELNISESDTVRLRAVTYLGSKPPQYSWESSHNEIVAIEPDLAYSTVAWGIGVGVEGQTAIIRVFDRANGLDRQVKVELVEKGRHPLPLEPEMVVIPAGRFQMGCLQEHCPLDGSSDPPHTVTVGSFALSKYEVTFAEYDRFAAATDRRLPDDEGWGRGWRPVINVTWNEAVAFAEWLSNTTRKRYRLPSEAEWEYACRAGTTTLYSWGDESRSYGGDDEMTDPVGSSPSNAWGLHDMHGNVQEWVQDCWNKGYWGAPTDGSAWMSGFCSRRYWHPRANRMVTRQVRGVRGGNSHSRVWRETGHASYRLGFRVAQDF
ncbi:MAG: SUMF1/EgtB/PvdO family nonheme iron enzyme [Gemmatimonadota bacterium]|nr:SUMF1/EgtB/PvdO family nonheme iron enzyme [Gemmatimonadota bacterium]